MTEYSDTTDPGEGVTFTYRHPVDRLFDGIIAALKRDQRVKLSTLDIEWLLRDVRHDAEELFDEALEERDDDDTLEGCLEELRQEFVDLKSMIKRGLRHE
jgi:hypothetical protein